MKCVRLVARNKIRGNKEKQARKRRRKATVDRGFRYRETQTSGTVLGCAR